MRSRDECASWSTPSSNVPIRIRELRLLTIEQTERGMEWVGTGKSPGQGS